MNARAAVVLVLLAISMHPAGAQQEGKISGYMFGDYFFVIANHDQRLEKQNGFWFRRIYAAYDRELSPEFAMRFRLEMNSPGDFGAASAKLAPFIKDAYVKWLWSGRNVVLGISPSPTWELVEKIWGYRSVEKTPLDLQRFGGSRDFGVALQGAFDSHKKLRYHLMIGNGSDTGSEIDKDKKVYLSLTAIPVKGFTIEVYTDWENRKGEKDQYTFQGFVSYERPDFRAGVQAAQQTRQGGPGAEDARLEIASIFAAKQLAPKAWALVRFDRMFDPNPAADKIAYIPFARNARSNLLLLGVDLAPVKDVHLIPNVEAVLYDGGDKPEPESDLIPRLTFHYTF